MGNGQAAGSALFSAGVSRLESLARTARCLEGLAAAKQAGGVPQDALALRLLAIQVWHLGVGTPRHSLFGCPCCPVWCPW